MSAKRNRVGPHIYGAGRSSRSRADGARAKTKSKFIGFRLVRDSGYRFFRGTTWTYAAKASRTSDAAGSVPNWGSETVGFRLVRGEEDA